MSSLSPATNTTTTTTTTQVTEEQQKVIDAENQAREREEQAALPYKWTQDLPTVTISVPVPPGTRGKEVEVIIKKRYLKVKVKSSNEPILEGDLFDDIKEEDSTWTIQDDLLSIELEKLSNRTFNSQWWPHILTHHPKIDTTKIVPENSKLSDLDGETRGMVEKMMFDNRQKQMGKPTSDEQRKTEMLDKFKAAHPEMDFSQAKMS